MFAVITTAGSVQAMETATKTVAMSTGNQAPAIASSGDWPLLAHAQKLTKHALHPAYKEQDKRQQLHALNISEQHYLTNIRQLESEKGAYAPRLSEQNHGLAMVYYLQGKYKKAVSLLKRALHVQRVNNGLYNIAQIPILKQMINNHIQLQDYARADKQHYYLYRTRLKNYQHDDPQRIKAIRDYALWQREAYLLNLGEQRYRRLISMYNLQTQALALAERRYGVDNNQILPLLDDLSNTHYLLSSHSDAQDTDPQKVHYDKTELDFLRLNSYANGVTIFKRKIAIHNVNPQTSINTRVDAVVALGDWYQWNRKRANASKAYAKAYQLLANNEAGQQRLEEVFGRPRALPATGAFDSDLLVNKDKKKGYITTEFTVTQTGIAREIHFLKTEPEHYERKQWRLKKSIKKTVFRPRFENAKPVNTQRIVHRYEFYY